VIRTLDHAARLVGHRALRTVPRVAALWEFLAEHMSDPARAVELSGGA